MAGDEATNLYQFALVAVMEFPGKNVYLLGRKYLLIFLQMYLCKLCFNYFVFDSFVLCAIWRKRDFGKYSGEIHNQTSLSVTDCSVRLCCHECGERNIN